jgi:hypothetical protein
MYERVSAARQPYLSLCALRTLRTVLPHVEPHSPGSNSGSATSHPASALRSRSVAIAQSSAPCLSASRLSGHLSRCTHR